jgi:hypothetical protein
MNNIIFLYFNHTVHQFSFQGEHITSWQLMEIVCKITASNGCLFFACYTEGVLTYTTDGRLLQQINMLQGRKICATNVVVDDENIIIQDMFEVYICTLDGEYVDHFYPSICSARIELTPQLILYQSCGRVNIRRRDNHHHHYDQITKIEKANDERIVDFCVLYDIGCVATLDTTGSIDFYRLKPVNTSNIMYVCVIL